MHGLWQGKGSRPDGHKEIVTGLGVAARSAVARVPLDTDRGDRLEEADN